MGGPSQSRSCSCLDVHLKVDHEPRGDCSGPVADPSLQFWVLHELPAVFGTLSLVNSVNIQYHEVFTNHHPRQASSRLHLTTIKDFVPFDFVLRAYTAFFRCFEFSSFNASFVDVLFGFTRKICFRIHWIQGFRVLFSALSLASFVLSSPCPLLAPPSLTLISSTRSTILTTSELGTNPYPCTYLMSYFVTLTLTYTHIHIHTHNYNSQPHAPLIGFVCIRTCTLKDYVVAG